MGVVLVDECGKPVRNGFEPYPCNSDAAALFLICSTQWDRSPVTGALLGLPSPRVEATARLAGIDVTPDLFESLQLIERGALGAVADLPELDNIQVLHVGFDDNGQ